MLAPVEVGARPGESTAVPLPESAARSGRTAKAGPRIQSTSDHASEPVRQSRLIRFLDVVFGAVGLLAGLPLFLAVSALIWLRDGRPIFFVQVRLGQDKEPIRVVKFRTMVENAEEDGLRWAREGDDRITAPGRFLRMTRLDELPQLWNVLKGDMTLVGPRPIRAYFADQLEEMDPAYRQRFRVKPGVTGWAQLYAPYGSTLEEQLEKLPYDLRYVREGLFIGQYCKILWLTVFSVFRAEGV